VRRSRLLLLIGAAALAGCEDTEPVVIVPGGQPARGEMVIEASGCGACHTIPGVRGARGLVGPPLTSFGRRTFIAGEVPNTPANLVRWVRDPQSIAPRTAMPDLGLNEMQARDVAAFLYTMR
jgi:cytochrome c1